jgi:GT2 family glycosyltransferase
VRFSVVIPTFRRKEILRATLEQVCTAVPPPDEILIVDADGSGEVRTLVEELSSLEPATKLRYFHTEPSLTRQRNVGIEQAEGDVIVFLDDDVSIPEDLFDRLAPAYEDEEVVGATGHVVEPESGRLGGTGTPLRRLLVGGEDGTFTSFGYPRYIAEVGTPRDVEWMGGCFMTARREAAARVRFDEFMGGYALAEDEDFSYRLSRLGRVRYLPHVVVHHDKLGFASKDPRDFNRLVVRNRTYLFRKNFDRGPVSRLKFGLFLGVLFGHRVVNREWRAAQGIVEGAIEVARGPTAAPLDVTREPREGEIHGGAATVSEGEEDAVPTNKTP